MPRCRQVVAGAYDTLVQVGCSKCLWCLGVEWVLQLLMYLGVDWVLQVFMMPRCVWGCCKCLCLGVEGGVASAFDA